MRERQPADALRPDPRETWSSYERLCRRMSPEAWRRADVQARAIASIAAEAAQRPARAVIPMEDADEAAAGERHWAARVLR